ncbi:MAG: hypothetical protein U9R53_03195 [Chloroflexota bacterium]|nr:hypothetical protein [Chloroflexota bacterium]
MATDKKTPAVTHPTQRQLIFLSWTKDILIYIIVLNLFIEYSPVVIIDSFTISIFTAILLKILLEIIFKLEHKVSNVFKTHKFLRIFITWVILFGSKFVILELIDIIFGEHVKLGKFLDVILLVIALILAREIFHRIYIILGSADHALKEGA